MTVKVPGLLGNAGTNPLLNMGIGLLSAGGYSTMPISTGQGIAAGFQNMQQAGLLSQRQALEQQKIEILKAKQREAEIEADRQARERVARNAAVGQLLQQLPPEQQAVLGPMFDADPDAAMKVAQGLLFPEAPELPGAVQIAQWYQNASPEERAAFDASKRAGAASTSITNVMPGGGPKFETGPGKAINDYLLARDAFGEDDPRTQALKEAASPKSQQGVAGDRASAELYAERARTAVTAYESAQKRFQENPTAANKAAVDQAMSALATAVAQARNIKGEPGDALIREVREATPGPIRSKVQSALGLGNPTKGALDQLKRELNMPVGGGLLRPDGPVSIVPKDDPGALLLKSLGVGGR